MTPPVRALVLGAISRDVDLGTGSGGVWRPGGVVVHAGTALASLGARVRVVTRVALADRAVLLAPLTRAGVEVLALPSRETTTCANDYQGPHDRHELRAVSDPIGPTDVPAAWRDADVVQLGPLHPADLLPETVAIVRGLRGLDLQGLVRAPGGARRAPSALARFLAHADVVQVSEHDLPAVLAGEAPSRFAARQGLGELIVTRGARGATLLTPAGVTEVPAAPAAAHARAGAGDVFLAAYLLLRVLGRDPVAAAHGGARAAALKVAHGELPPGLGPAALAG